LTLESGIHFASYKEEPDKKDSPASSKARIDFEEFKGGEGREGVRSKKTLRMIEGRRTSNEDVSSWVLDN